MCLEILAFVKQVVVVFALDEIDKKILVELLTNSNRSNREIARAINVSAATVINRIQRLESAGVIKDYTVMLDYERLGFELTVIMEVTVSKGKLLEVQTSSFFSTPCLVVFLCVPRFGPRFLRLPVRSGCLGGIGGGFGRLLCL